MTLRRALRTLRRLSRAERTVLLADLAVLAWAARELLR